MTTRRLIPRALRTTARAAALAVAAATCVVGATAPAGAASPAAACSGAACTGKSPVTEGCLADKVEVQDQSVPGLGDVYLYESAACQAAWAQLNVSPGSVAVAGNQLAQLSELVYVPALGGAESIGTTSWDGNTNDVAYSPMYPSSGSVKACGGNPNGDLQPFDEDPQGIDNISQPGLASQDSFGACTLWH